MIMYGYAADGPGPAMYMIVEQFVWSGKRKIAPTDCIQKYVDQKEEKHHD